MTCQDVVFFRPGKKAVLDGISFSLGPGELIGLLGVNGVGKSTLLRLLLGFLRPRSGEIRFEDRLLDEWAPSMRARRLAYVPQNHGPAFSYTVRRMVELGRVPYCGMGGRLTSGDHIAVDVAMERLDLTDMATRPVTHLSGGERQRVLLARALAQEARFLLLDEPMTGLDYGHQHRLMALLKSLVSEGCTVLLTSHQPERLLTHADRVMVLDRGRIVADGMPGDIITAQRMSRLYDVALRQIDYEGSRFFTAE